jgi:hypothetical protein
VHAGAGVALRGSKDGHLRFSQATQGNPASDAHGNKAERGPSHGAEGRPHPRSGFLQLLTPSASPDAAEGSASAGPI